MASLFLGIAAEDGFAAMATLAQIAGNAANLSIPLYVKRATTAVNGNGVKEAISLRSAWDQWQTEGRAFWQQMDALVEILDGLDQSIPLLHPSDWREF